MKRNNGIDLFKLLAAFCVMLAHGKYGNLPQEYVDNIALGVRWVFPFFFLSTGYFLKPKVNNFQLDFHSIQKNIAHLITMLIIASLIYLPLQLDVIARPGIVHIFTGSFYHLWFIGSMIFGYIFIWYVYFIRMDKVLPFISIAILLLALLYDSYDHFFNVSLDFETYRFLLSVPFMYAGLSLRSEKLRNRHVPLLIAMVLIGFGVLYFESILFNRVFHYGTGEHQFLFGMVIAGTALFYLVVLMKLKDNKLSDWGRKYSLFIYLYHPWVYVLLPGILKRILPAQYYGTAQVLSPLIAFGVLLFLCILFEKYRPSLFNLLNGSSTGKKLAVKPALVQHVKHHVNEGAPQITLP
jgi:hypothetical protein